ncbi:MAG: ORC1-type DNA replication protein [Thermofilaceae archaeon]
MGDKMSGGFWLPTSKIFRDEGKLQVDYVPRCLPFREEQLNMLREYFKPFLLKPGSVFVRVLLLGSVGTGKTAVVRRFGEDLNGAKLAKGASARFAYVNCHAHRSLFSIMQKIGKDLGLNVPRRGFSREELLMMIWSYLKNSNEYLVAAIDEADYIAHSGEEALYVLTRLTEIVEDEVHRIGLVFVFRDLTFMMSLDRSVQSTLQHNIIRFYPYTSEQLEEILMKRVEEGALYESAISDEVIEMIGELVGYDRGGSGDARLALEILYRAGKYAESEDRESILPEDIRRAHSDVMPFPKDALLNLKLDEKLLLLALARLLQRKKFISKVPMGLLELEYHDICEEHGLAPKRHTAVWECIRNMSRMGIISTGKPGKGQKGRTTLIGLPAIPLKTLEKELLLLIREDLSSGAADRSGPESLD